MFFKSLLATTTLALFAVQAAAAPSSMTSNEVKAPSNDDSMGVLIAPDAISACNCPNNCRHKDGSSCKFYREGHVISAVCRASGQPGVLKCM